MHRYYRRDLIEMVVLGKYGLEPEALTIMPYGEVFTIKRKRDAQGQLLAGGHTMGAYHLRELPNSTNDATRIAPAVPEQACVVLASRASADESFSLEGVVVWSSFWGNADWLAFPPDSLAGEVQDFFDMDTTMVQEILGWNL